jgi:hypothetical protein
VRELGTPGVMLSGDPGERSLLGGLKAGPSRPGGASWATAADARSLCTSP